MQIKTAVTLGTGAAVGFLFGLTVTEKTREKIVRKIRDKLIYFITGEERCQTRNKGPVPHRTTYTYYTKYAKRDKTDDWNHLKYEVVYFDTDEEARAFLTEILRYVKRFNYISVMDLYYMRNKNIDYTWDQYGWGEEDILDSAKVINNWIELPRPVNLYERRNA